MGEIERQLKRARHMDDAAACRARGIETVGDAVADLHTVAQQFEDARRHIDDALAELHGDGQWEDSIRSAFESAAHAAAALEDARARLDAVALGKLEVDDQVDDQVDGAEQPGGG